MSSIPDWWANVQKVYAEHGYIVIGSMISLSCGHIVKFAYVPGSDGDHIRMLCQPFVVVGPATREEFLAQSQTAGWRQPGAMSWVYYYKATTD